jgi:RNA polymerase sigma-70 factor (ECF subfamily)
LTPGNEFRDPADSSPLKRDEFIARYSSIVYNLALRLTGNKTDAGDVAQESLLKALNGLHRFNGGDAGVWVYRITVNSWKNWVRSQSTRRFLRFFSTSDDTVLSEPDFVSTNELDPEATLLAAHESLRIESAMLRLSSEERAVLVLRELDGRSYDQISEVLEIPLGTVKSRLARARIVLAEALSEENDDPS